MLDEIVLKLTIEEIRELIQKESYNIREAAEHMTIRTVVKWIIILISVLILCITADCSFEKYLKVEAVKTNNLSPYEVKTLFNGINTQVDPNLMIKEIYKNKLPESPKNPN